MVLITPLNINDIQQGLAGFGALVIFDDLRRHGFGIGKAGDMGRDDNFRVAPEGVVFGQGLDCKYIQAGAGQLP